MSFLRRVLAPGYALALTLAVTAPLLAPGYLLLRDAVSTPRSYLSDDALGLSESAPRALPQDFFVAVASHVIDGGVVVKALLILGLWLAGWGAARLAAFVVADAGVAGSCVAATVAIWNPYVAERLLQGHWSLLVGYGCLPWVAASMLRFRNGGAVWPLLMWIALAGLTPTGLMLAATVALVAATVPGNRSGLRCAATALGISVLVALPWLTASALSGLSSGDSGIAAFAARAEPGLGTLGSLAGLGGIWNADGVPASRGSMFAVVGSAVLLGIVGLGLPAVRRRPAAVALLILGAVAVVVPAAMATGPGLAVVEAVVRALPGLGVVRDAQKWVALAMPGYALAAAGAVVTLRRWVPGPAAAAVCCAALIAVLPDLVWGVGGAVQAVRYPAGWSAVAARINADPRPVAVLPPDTMRRFAWSGPAPVLDPLPRWVRAHVWSTGDLTIGGRTVAGDGEQARRIQQLLLGGAAPAQLADAGVGWVAVESDQDIALYRVGGDAPGASSRNRALMVGTHLVWLAVLIAGVVGTARLTLCRRSASNSLHNVNLAWRKRLRRRR